MLPLYLPPLIMSRFFGNVHTYMAGFPRTAYSGICAQKCFKILKKNDKVCAQNIYSNKEPRVFASRRVRLDKLWRLLNEKEAERISLGLTNEAFYFMRAHASY